MSTQSTKAGTSTPSTPDDAKKGNNGGTPSTAPKPLPELPDLSESHLVTKRINVLQRLAAGNSAALRQVERDLKTRPLSVFTRFRSRLDTAKNVTEQHQRDARDLAAQLEQLRGPAKYASVSAKADLLEPDVMRMAVAAQALRNQIQQ
ncbi:uncharacterized protein PG986_014575 [Apiospora aurea]|uniref:Uncharacterized protein n=1 Tax=Apiospora aurea TaxID=335848 RepID=A0ABR1PTN7_9PEZI